MSASGRTAWDPYPTVGPDPRPLRDTLALGDLFPDVDRAGLAGQVDLDVPVLGAARLDVALAQLVLDPPPLDGLGLAGEAGLDRLHDARAVHGVHAPALAA